MYIIICPGIHSPHLTQSFLQGLHQQENGDLSTNFLIFPAQDDPAYSAIDILEFIKKHVGIPSKTALPVLFISFSAGVVGAVGAAWEWQMQRGQVKALIALDGWGVPLGGNFPIHRLSHDYFTHWSSRLLGAGQDSFYADPSVGHLQLWRSPQKVQGWWVRRPGCQVRCCAAEFLTTLLKRYGEA